MFNLKTQPSLSRDFAILSSAILFVLCIISLSVTYSTYTGHAESVVLSMEKESERIDVALATEMQSASYLLSALGKQIVLDDERDLVRLAQVMKSFDNKDYIYSILSWISPEQMLVVSSNKGVLEKPVDISDRDYVKKAFSEPWKMNIGRPIEGRVSGRWIIPVSMGITDYTGKFIGSIMLSIDIDTLTDRLARVMRQDGLSFAIVSKTLIPITQVSEDKDFVNNNFPLKRLVNVNFSKEPQGVISRGSVFFGTNNYAYYRVAQDYPYVILLAYDPRISDLTVRRLVWSRLLQIAAMATFFVCFVWIARVRMIKPVLDLTELAAGIARGERLRTRPQGGPVEIEGLALQMNKIGDYIEESARIQNELRNKIIMMRNAKEKAEIERRSLSEFLAYVCQEMRTPLNNIIGGAQVMKDQLYGPIENRKYRQYATDIYGTGNQLMDTTQDLLTLAKIETDYIDLNEKPVDVPAAINKALRFVSDKMQAERMGIKVQLQDPMPRLMADEFRLQQVIMNLLLYTLGQSLPESTITLEAKIISEGREKLYFALTIASSSEAPFTSSQLLDMAESLSRRGFSQRNSHMGEATKDQLNVGLELAKTLVALHGGYHSTHLLEPQGVAITVFFPGNRIRTSES